MGKIKQATDDTKSYVLTPREFDFLKILSYALDTSIFKDKVISGFTYYLCNTRFGYAENVSLTFEIDLADESRTLKVRDVTDEPLPPAPPQEP